MGFINVQRKCFSFSQKGKVKTKMYKTFANVVSKIIQINTH